ncbi:MAG TPA: NAD-dependent epimerase/dehydratase family protein [Granulicella sp.]|jgi:dTDP-L-rhamnose 4-epimerase|nr:NAD-dependent epimerase/dehydratase family protein [Granulicella sp.]
MIQPGNGSKYPSHPSKQILITGGAGFIGSHLADALLASGHRVRVLDSLLPPLHPNGRPEYLSGAAELVRGDIRDPKRLREVLPGVDIIFHLAATNGAGQPMDAISRSMSVNAQGTTALLQAMLDFRVTPEKLIVASSMSIYGEGQYVCSVCSRQAFPDIRASAQLQLGRWEVRCADCGGVLMPRPTHEAKPSAIHSIHALSKRDQEDLCLLYGRTSGVPVTALRLFNVYGTRQTLSSPNPSVAALFAARLIRDQAPLVLEDGAQIRDLVSVHDVVRASLLAMERSESDGQVINVGCGIPITIRRIAQILAAALGKKIEPVITQRFRAGDIRHCYADQTKARRLLRYEPRVSHDQGLCELAEWLLQRQSEPQASRDRVPKTPQLQTRVTACSTNGNLMQARLGRLDERWLSEDYAQSWPPETSVQ